LDHQQLQLPLPPQLQSKVSNLRKSTLVF
jgi:hypothetical protein